VPTFSARLAVALALTAAFSTPVLAQKDLFRDALIAFHSKLAGEDGNEGPAVTANLQRMEAALAAWDERTRTSADTLRELDAAIISEPGRGDRHVLRGLVLEAMGRQDEARSAFERASALDPEDPVAGYLLASAVRLKADTTEVRLKADTAGEQTARLLQVLDRRLTSLPRDLHVELFPEIALVPDRAAVTPVFSPALYAEGFRLLMDGRYAEALATFRRAIARDPLVTAGPGEPRRIQAGVYADAGNEAKSIEELQAAVRLSPDDERSNVALGRALTHAGQSEQAERVLLDTIRKLPESADAHSALADLYEKLNRGQDALREVEAAAAFPVLAGKAALYYRVADLHHRFLEYDLVIDPLARRVRLIPNDARAHTDLGLALTRVGRDGDALVELAMAAIIGPDDAEALTAIGQIHFDAGNYRAGETVLRRAIAATPAYAKARYLMAQTLARLGRERESQEQMAEYDRLRAAANEETRKNFEKGIR
jgi:tetratricopeptide (TPR) repeat protein